MAPRGFEKGNENAATGCLNRLSALLMAHRWRSVGGAQSWDVVESGGSLTAWNVGNALTASGQPLSALGRSRGPDECCTS